MSILLDPATPITGDVLRIVTLSPGGRPIEALNLNDGTGYFRQRDQDFTFTPAASNVQYSSTARRYGGARAVGQTHENGTIAWTCYVKGSSDTDIRTRVENLLAQIAEVGRGRYVEWAPGSGRSSFFELAGPGDWQPGYQVRQFIEGFTVSVQLTFPVLPLVRWAPMTIRDDYAADSTADYTFDAMTATDVTITSGKLSPAGTLTTIRRARHTARGYTTLEGQQTVRGAPGVTITGYRLGVELRASASTGIDIYVDDNGTNSRLRIDVNTGAGWVNRASTNLASRVSNGTALWVRGRVEGNVVYAEHFITSPPTPMGTPTTSTSYTLTGAEITLPAGHAGWAWIPQHASAYLDDFEFLPYVRRNQTLPDVLSFADALPGNAPALADVSVSPSGGAAAPVWAQIGWAATMDDVGGAWGGTSMSSLYGIVEAEHAPGLGGGWATSAQAGARGGTDVRASAGGINTYTADFPYLLLSPLVGLDYVSPDDFSDTATVEVWARVLVSSTLAGARMTASLRRASGAAAGETFTQEFGPAGRLLTLPVGGTHYRKTRLGTLMLNSDLFTFMIRITATTTSGSAAVPFGLDYIWLVPARSRALGPTGLANDATYPAFVPDTNAWTKTIRSDLSGRLDDTGGTAPGFRSIHHGLNGSLLELDPGTQSLLVALGSQVPDDPTASVNDDQLAHSATVNVDVVPRSFLLRS